MGMKGGRGRVVLAFAGMRLRPESKFKGSEAEQ